MKIALLPGDGIGKEVTAQAVKALRALDLPLEMETAPVGEEGIESCGDAVPPATLELARRADAILLGATGVPADEHRPLAEGAGAAVLRLRADLKLFANFRPISLFPELIRASTLRPEIVEGVDMVILRELNGDIYFGQPRGIETTASGARVGFNTMRYSEPEIERIGRAAFEAARKRRRKVCSVDKANVLETMALWREVMTRVGRDYPDVELTHLYVDAAAMALMRNPRQFDVMVCGNMFGDILSDAAAMLTGSIGMLPSASLGEGPKGLYEPVHGSAPDIAGRNIANPIAAILSAAMMLRHSLGLAEAAGRIERAVRAVLRAGWRTADIMETGCRQAGTEEMGDAIADELRRKA
ncbi:MAG TPA: 3-isopropylmalate dehydrogenase [Bryobacteraceae bacterium]|jgi:3-isopropylmalate dehydrogenase|nr:3-isopropylmalate dehydrogenase [Bryobacteraceae bacterium]